MLVSSAQYKAASPGTLVLVKVNAAAVAGARDINKAATNCGRQGLGLRPSTDRGQWALGEAKRCATWYVTEEPGDGALYRSEGEQGTAIAKKIGVRFYHSDFRF